VLVSVSNHFVNHTLELLVRTISLTSPKPSLKSFVGFKRQSGAQPGQNRRYQT
jgi:hypothetical protein